MRSPLPHVLSDFETDEMVSHLTHTSPKLRVAPPRYQSFYGRLSAA